jgi:hypothetical protein
MTKFTLEKENYTKEEVYALIKQVALHLCRSMAGAIFPQFYKSANEFPPLTPEDFVDLPLERAEYYGVTCEELYDNDPNYDDPIEKRKQKN